MTISLYELVDDIPLGLPMPKDSVIIPTYGNMGRKIKFWTPDGYLTRVKFIEWINSNNLTVQDWYDRYYLNIVSVSQRPKCQLNGCEEVCKFNSNKSLGYNYLKHCCHSHCQISNHTKESSIKLSNSLRSYFSDKNNRKLRSEQTKAGFKKNGLYELDENGLNAFSRNQYKYHSSEVGRRNDKIRAENLKKENNPEFSAKMRSVMGTDEARRLNSESVRKSMSNPELRMHLSRVRKIKYRTDKEFRVRQFSILKRNSKGKSGYVYSDKCLNSVDNFVSYDSTYELAFITLMDNEDNVLSYIREPKDLDISYVLNDEIHYYLPDFIVEYSDGCRKMIEIKPKSLVSDNVVILKSKSAIEWCKIHDMAYEVLTEDDIFSVVNKDYVLELHRCHSSIRKGFKSTNDKIKEFVLNNIK